MGSFHQNWFYVATAATAAAGMWGLTLALLRRQPGRWFYWARNAAIVAMLLQVGAGLVLLGQGNRPGDSFHIFYGVVIVVTLALAYVYRATLSQRPALWYGLLLLFVMGLGLRAWQNVG